MYTNVPPQLWMQIPKAVREKLVEVFELKRTGITEIRDQDIIQDGYSVEDLKGITLEKMTAYIGSEETFPRAWELSCEKAGRIEIDTISIISTEGEEEVIHKANPQKNAETKKTEQK